MSIFQLKYSFKYLVLKISKDITKCAIHPVEIKDIIIMIIMQTAVAD
jgi:hypothetical protein